jgi:hypothetical protein
MFSVNLGTYSNVPELAIQRVKLDEHGSANHAVEELALKAAKESGNVEYLAATVLSWFPTPDDPSKSTRTPR